MGVSSDSLVDRLVAAGFEVLEAPYRGGGTPSEAVAWRCVSSSLVRPSYVISHDAEDGIRELDVNWRRLARQCGAVGVDGTVLISLTKLAPGGSGWALVSLPEGPLDLGALGPNPGDPEFVTMAKNGEILCAVTAEEYGMWIISSRLEN